MTQYVGEEPRGSNGARSTLCWIAVTLSAPHNQIGPLWCWFPSGWACACPRPLWVSPTTSPVRLGVSLAASPTPTGVFNQKFESSFCCAGALGYVVVFAPRCSSGLSVHDCGATVSASGQTACPFHPTLRQSQSHHGKAPRQGESSPPWLPISAPLTGLDECLFFISLVSDFLAVRFSVSSGCFLFVNCCCPPFGCVRRHRMSTYISILAGSPNPCILKGFM